MKWAKLSISKPWACTGWCPLRHCGGFYWALDCILGASNHTRPQPTGAGLCSSGGSGNSPCGFPSQLSLTSLVPLQDIFSHSKTFSKIILVSFQIWSSHQTSYFLWFCDSRDGHCGPRLTWGPHCPVSLWAASLPLQFTFCFGTERMAPSSLCTSFGWLAFRLHSGKPNVQCCLPCFPRILSISPGSSLLSSSPNLQLFLEFPIQGSVYTSSHSSLQLL